ncbi:MAG: hypothetical protein HXX20_24430 [Chloroflexi bacterium]|nr:hypothetical protein [Chloroflexota bacterium]
MEIPPTGEGNRDWKSLRQVREIVIGNPSYIGLFGVISLAGDDLFFIAYNIPFSMASAPIRNFAQIL